jgi:hypothetical protein
VHLLYNKKYDKETPADYDAFLNSETDTNGEAHFKLPEPPPVHFSALVRVDEWRWKCGCRILVSTNDLAQKGIVGPLAETDSKKYAAHLKPTPGEILFAAWPSAFFERLLYPFMKE